MKSSEYHSFLIKTGIAACGVVDTSRPLTYDAYCTQIAKGIPQNLGYLQKNATCREGFEAIMPGTKSVLCFGIAMPKMPATAPCHFARFCAIGDYHTVLRDRIGQVLHFLKDHFPIENSRICVDTAPVLERELAIRAGFGSIGYNHMIIHPQWGSYISGRIARRCRSHALSGNAGLQHLTSIRSPKSDTRCRGLLSQTLQTMRSCMSNRRAVIQWV